ncbi:MAG TPA: hypothetical protein DIC34_09170 [Treponema sp.]|nr:MAG: hypothetical protein A2001_02275 [Treponema sp. GWC1_61_84]HCM26698.1 hypothetical protein [Treponema sp.]
MKLSLPIGVAFAMSVILLAASCAGAPKPAPTPPEEPVAATEKPAPVEEKPAVVEKAPPVEVAPVVETVDETTLRSFADAKERAEKNRKQAFDLEAPAYLPAEWKSAEAQFLDGRSFEAKATAPTEVAAYKGALSSYTSAADGFEAVAREALPLFARDRAADLAKARKTAVDAGIESVSASRLARADGKADEAASLFAAADFYGAYAAWKDAREMYVILYAGAAAYYVKTDIDKRGIAGFDSGNYSLATGKLDAALVSFDGGRLAPARDDAEESLLRFRLALAKGRELYAYGRGTAADAARAEARALKAQVAVKAEFDAASDSFAKAQALYKAENFDDASAKFIEAERMFASARDNAAIKRAAAEKALKEAADRIAENERAAMEADIVLEGGAR